MGKGLCPAGWNLLENTAKQVAQAALCLANLVQLPWQVKLERSPPRSAMLWNLG